ncbi:hypothetical protein AB833_13390 [Chromatiales bacterium (ex Bugula neritina AB1)]|nr:hypothetical protein AB833_13390 [Chromatiales bacterium (ex Bugula neritina AB1)]
MDFNQVRYFLAVSETLNFTRAAEQCHVTQPALTQAIKRLESELGGELLHRDGRYSELTVLGKSLRNHFQQIDRTRQLVRATARAVTSGEVAELNIGLMCTIGPVALGSLINRFQMEHPMVSLVLHDVTPDSIVDLLLSGAIQGAFCSKQGTPNQNLNYLPLFQETICVVFPQDHPFTQLDAVPLQSIAEYPYIDRLHCEFRSDYLRLCADCELDLNVAFRSQREDWIQCLIGDGLGVSVIPRYSLCHPALNHRPIADPPLSRQIAFATVNQPDSAPALDLLMQLIQSHDWSPYG